MTHEPRKAVGEQGRYEIGRLLGSGAFGRVYEGKDRKLDGRRVAIKHLLPQARQSREVWTRFLQEARILATLNHPHIINIYDIDEANDCLVLEFAAGGTLEGLLEKQGRLPIHRTLEIALEILDALDAVHDKCIWHRDLKPANVLLDGSMRAKLTDFGIAHASIESGVKLAETRVNAVMGTPIYMAPEQLRGEPLDGRADLWAVGAMLYQMLTGVLHLPVWALDGVHAALVRDKLLEMILTRRPRRPSEVNSTLPPEVDVIVQRALEPKPQDRYATAEEMKRAVKKLLRRLPDPNETASETASPPVLRPSIPEVPSSKSQDSGALSDSTLPQDLLLLEQARGLKDPEQIASLLGPACALPTASPRLLLALAEARVAQRNFAVALELAERACRLDGAPVDAFRMRGTCLSRVGRNAQAVDAYRAALARFPSDAGLFEALAVALHNDGSKREALDALERAAALEPSRASVRRLLRAWSGAT